ncbi:MAG: hypothetical protein HZB41_11305 [Ignavibacteriae bacterium]|nr:hypothetical protein [Ignavibacteriota bacterium]
MKKKEDIATVKQNIKDAFFSLSDEEQVELLKELSTVSGTAVSINDFSTKHQRVCGQNIQFSPAHRDGPSHNPVVSITVHTSFGTFKGEGSNQKIAKANAIAKAEEEAPWSNLKVNSEQ